MRFSLSFFLIFYDAIGLAFVFLLVTVLFLTLFVSRFWVLTICVYSIFHRESITATTRETVLD